VATYIRVKGDGVARHNVVEQLSRVPLFSGCSRRDLQTIARVVKDIDHGAGTVIAREGEPGIGLFVIVDGYADVTIGGVKKATLGPGDFFGEIALLRDVPRTATVRATTALRLHALDRDTFVSTVTGHAASAEAAGSIVAARLPSPVAN